MRWYSYFVSAPQFLQPRSTSIYLPLFVAVTILVAAIFLLIRYTPQSTAGLTITHTATYQARTVFKSDTILVKKDSAQDDLYVVMTLRIDDRLNLPLFLKDLTATLITADGHTLTTNAAEKTDLTPLLTTFPALKPLASPPLLRDTLIARGQSVEGMVLLQFPITQDTWNHRQSATLNVDFYHQGPQTVPIPQP